MVRTDKIDFSVWLLLLVSFIEGGAVMAVELMAAKIIATFYGSSLYVWSAVLAITMIGLSSGYYFGGRLSSKTADQAVLFNTVLLSAIFVLLLPFISVFIMDLTMDLNLKIGIIVSALIFIFPPLICFGMVSPMIIRLLSTKVNYAGKAAGTVYSVSTTGGIIATFFFGFYLIPEVGLTIGCVLVALAMGIFPLFYFLRNKTLPFVKVKPTKI